MRTLKEEVAYCQSKGFFRNTIELSTMLAWLGEQAVIANRIAALEAKVRELEAIDAARTNAVQDAIDNAAIYQDQLTTSRQQVERLEKGLFAVEALINESQGVTGLHLNGDVATWESLRTGGQFDAWLVDFDEALAAIEQYTKGRKA